MPSIFSRNRKRSQAAGAAATLPAIPAGGVGSIDDFGRPLPDPAKPAKQKQDEARSDGEKRRIRLLSGPWSRRLRNSTSASVPPSPRTPTRRAAPAQSPRPRDDSTASALPSDPLPPRYHFLPTRFPLLTKKGGAITQTTLREGGPADLAGGWVGLTDEGNRRSYGYISIDTGLVLGLEDVVHVVDDVSKEMEDRALTTPMLFSSAALDLSGAKIRFLIRSYVDTLCEGDACRRDAGASTATYRSNLRFAHPHELAWFLRWALARVVRVKGEPIVLGDAFELEQRGLVDWEDYETWRGRERAGGWQANAWDGFLALLPPVLSLCLRSLFDLLGRLTAHSLQSGLTPARLSALFGPLLFGLGRPSCSFEKAHASYIRASAATEHLLLAFIRSQHASHDRLRGEFPRALKAWIRGYPSMIVSDHQLARPIPRKEAQVVRARLAHRTVRAYSRDLLQDGATWQVDLPRSLRLSEAHRRRLALDKDVLPRLPAAVAPDSAWSVFEEAGFARHSIADRLQFDLTEGAKRQIADKRRTMTWDDFSGGGFDRTSLALKDTLNFAPPLQDQIESWPDEREEIRRKLKKSAKVMAKFEYDTTPSVSETYIEAGFIDACVDLLDGWTDRDELTFREANWCILEYADGSIYVFEEVVPLDYQRSLVTKPKKGLTIFRKKKMPSLPRTHSRDEAEFDALMRKTDTRVLKSQPLASSVGTTLDPLMRSNTAKKQDEPDIETRTIDASSSSTSGKSADKWINVSLASAQAKTLPRPLPVPPAADRQPFVVSESQVSSALHAGTSTKPQHIRKGSAGVQRILTDFQLQGPTQDSEGRSIHSMAAMQVLGTPTEVGASPSANEQQQRVQEHIQKYRDAAQHSPLPPDPPRESVASVVDAYAEPAPAQHHEVETRTLLDQDADGRFETASGADDTRISMAPTVSSGFSFEAPPKLEDIEMIARQPSPGRYEHGAPLHFVGEEPEEEEEEEDYVHKTPARQIRRR